ncbi:hypothetical protein ACFQ0O_06030 [Saccharopolyspora spinosporotrichia]
MIERLVRIQDFRGFRSSRPDLALSAFAGVDLVRGDSGESTLATLVQEAGTARATGLALEVTDGQGRGSTVDAAPHAFLTHRSAGPVLRAARQPGGVQPQPARLRHQRVDHCPFETARARVRGASSGSWLLVNVSITRNDSSGPGSMRCTRTSRSSVVAYSRSHRSFGFSCCRAGTTVAFHASYCLKLMALKWVSSSQRTVAWSGCAAASALKATDTGPARPAGAGCPAGPAAGAAPLPLP